MEPRPEKRNSSRNYLIIALMVLIGMNVLQLYFWYQEREMGKTKDATIAAKTEEVLAAKTKLDSISSQLDLKISEIQQLGGNIDSLLTVRDQLEIDKRNLRNVNNFDDRKYAQRIREYESMLTQKDEEIARLRRENGILSAQNKTLSEENTGLRGEKQALFDSVVTYSSRNQELEKKVTIASALRAENILVNAINARGKESKGGVYKARRLDKINVSFRLGENGLAQQNGKTMYIRILDPSGAVVSDMATGSGEFIYNGQGMVYTAAQSIQFDNSRQQVRFVYGRGGQRFNEGRHVVEVYAEGFKIGESEFAVE